jgi:catechol 2,3-dioxygenase-like lactoylglutathione lyase family enzyme
MISRLDHVVIGARDIEAAMRTYTELGFDVVRGGSHPSIGTHNAIIRFGLDYLELLSILDRSVAASRVPFGSDVLEFLDAHQGGLLGYCLATSAIEEIADAMRREGFPVDGPFAMQRDRPDGTVLAWKLLVPGGSPWRKPWPFVIEWEDSDADRLFLERPGVHLNGVSSIGRVAVIAEDFGEAKRIYEKGLLLPVEVEGVGERHSARWTRYAVGDFRIDLLSPTGGGPLAQLLEQQGPGPIEVELLSADMSQTSSLLGGIAEMQADGFLVDAEATVGARFIIRERGPAASPG